MSKNSTRSAATKALKVSGGASGGSTPVADGSGGGSAASPGPFSVPVDLANAITALQRTVQSLAEEQRELIDGMKAQGSQLDELDKRFADVPEALKVIRSLMEERDQLQRRVSDLEDKVDRMEQQARSNNVEIRGVPLQRGEDLYGHVTKIADFAGVAITPADINFAHRVGGGKTAAAGDHAASQPPPNIVVSFVQKGKRDAFLRAARNKQPLTSRTLGFAGNSPVYCNEHLTLARKKLLAKVKSVREERKIKYVWVQNGSILVKKDDTSRAKAIQSYEDFLNMKL